MNHALPDTEKIKRSTDMVIGLIVVIFNILEIILIARVKKRKKKHYEIVLLSLSVADLLFGLSNAIVCVVFLVRQNTSAVLEIFYTTYFYFVLTSIFHLTFIGIDRLLAVVKPIKHNIFMTRKRLYKILAFIWIFSTVTAVTMYTTNEKTDAFKSLKPIHGTRLNYTQSSNYTVNNINKQLNSTNHCKRHTKPHTQDRDPNENLPPLNSNGDKQTPSPPPATFVPQNRTNSTTQVSRKCKRPPKNRPPAKQQMQFENKYKIIMSEILSYFIFVADAFLVLVYSFIIYRVNRKKTANDYLSSQGGTARQTERVSVVCIVVAGVFVTFTLPYALHRFIVGQPTYWVNILLVSNSAFNCVVYFFRGYLEKKRSLKKAKYVADSYNSNETPVTTPLPNRMYSFKKDSPEQLHQSVNNEAV